MHRPSGLRNGGTDGGSKIAGMYDLLETLGRGHFAVVKLARHVFTGEKVAVKVIDKVKLDDVSRSHLYQEVRCMKLVQHPNVVRLYDVIDTHTKLYLILELGDGGDLYDYIMRHEGQGLGEDVARSYFRQIVRAIDYCHRLHVVHRDLKPENVVFFETDGVVKLTDFGFSNRFCPGQKLETSCGSLAYSAPEILLGDSYDAPAVDVWSLGVILYMLVCGQAPFQEANDSETLTMIMDCKYTIPVHVSDGCKRLIARMLVREPEKRATLEEIAHDPWLIAERDENSEPELLPLVSAEQVSAEDQNLILQRMVNGQIASKDEILEALQKNEYNHITATYFLLAERRLRATRQPLQPKRPLARNKLKVINSSSNTPRVSVVAALEGEPDSPSAATNPSLLGTACTPADVGQNYRTRKCSIVTEEDDEEDDDIGGVSGSGSEDLSSACSLNRRGSRSEGKLSAMVKDRLAEVERRKESREKLAVSQSAEDAQSTSPVAPVAAVLESPSPSSSPRLKSLASPIPVSVGRQPTIGMLNEICEELECVFPVAGRPGRVSPRPMTSYDRRRSKFHKTRTTSCSSSDASDDDSESRKKRAHKLKNLPQRRDSHDDSSDSQDPGSGGGPNTGGGGGNLSGGGVGNHEPQQDPRTEPPGSNGGDRGSDNSAGGGGDRGGGGGPGSAGAHRTGRRRARETRLRESQSLNRITEVQESELSLPPPPRSAPSIGCAPPSGSSPCSTTVGSAPVSAPASLPRARSLGSRILHGLSLKSSPCSTATTSTRGTSSGQSARGSAHKTPQRAANAEKENICESNKLLKSNSGKKGHLLARYFQLHRKICLPLFSRGRLYKAQSCGSLTGGRGAHERTYPAYGDANQNVSRASVVGGACAGAGMCQIHLRDSSKCCSLC